MIDQINTKIVLKEILIKNCQLEEVDLENEKSLLGYLLDSIDIVILINELQKVFKIEIPIFEAAELKTIGALIDYIDLKKGEIS